MRDSTPAERSARQGGFTVVEIIIAVIVLAFGVLGMAGTTAYVVRQVTLAEVTSKRAAALQTVIEQVRATGYDNLGTGADTIGPFVVTWSSAVSGGRSTLVTIVTNGPGLSSTNGSFPMLAPSVRDTFTYRVIRP